MYQRLRFHVYMDRGWTWYLANDMQFFMLVPIVVRIFLAAERVGASQEAPPWEGGELRSTHALGRASAAPRLFPRQELFVRGVLRRCAWLGCSDPAAVVADAMDTALSQVAARAPLISRVCGGDSAQSACG